MTISEEPGTSLGLVQVGIVTEDVTVISMQEFSPGAEASCIDHSTPSRVTSAHSKGDATDVEKKHVETESSSAFVTAVIADPGAEKPVPVKARTWRLLRWHCSVPRYVWVGLAVFTVVQVLAVTGSIFYSHSVNRSARRAVADVGRTSARSIETHLDHLIAPMMSLANLVELQPHWPTLNESFPTFANAIYKTNPYFQVELCPYGIVGSMAMPWANATGNMTGEEYWQMMLSFEFGLDMLDNKRPSFQTEINAILQNGSVILLGPWYMPDGELQQGAFVVRYSIFLPPGNWDMPNSSIANCPYDVCHTPSGLKWWGWSNAVFAWRVVAAGLRPLDERGLRYTLSPDWRAANQSFLARTDPLPNPSECEHVSVNVYGWMSWEFCVEPAGGFGPTWAVGLLVGVTALAVLLGVLVALMLRSRDQAVMYLAKQLDLNRELAVAKEEAEEGHRVLAAEKRVMDALVQRQRNLIELFGKEDELLAGLEGDEAAQRRLMGLASSGQQGGGSQVSNLSRESATLDRIEAVRRQLTGQRSSKRSASPANDVKLMEMLGEGSFGKVYRGLWRGTDVAVKTMVLPANMSGAEKREKMAIMEAAISSSLAHPNIVQTYTYFIKTVREEPQPSEDGSMAAVAGILVGAGGTATELSGLSSSTTGGNKTFDEPSQRNSPAVHGYEVRLVLEYCDRGCLRDALDGDAFLAATGVNFSGVLDTAADIAKAMLHLHLADVLHGDLKARNVMLKSSGTEGRGVIGKVADFGLAVKMDTLEQTHMSGMYQGTLTHMAPELLLHGRMSKAADVYAFGITLWELFTGGNPFQGVPRALLGHQIAQERKRPGFPPFVPDDFVTLASDCWAHNPEDRPTFEVILERLARMRERAPGPAAPLASYNIGAPPPPPIPALRKLSGSGVQINSAASGNVYDPASAVGALGSGVVVGTGDWDPNGSGVGGGGLGGSGVGGGSTGGSINWMFARSSHRTPLAVVQEDDREMDVSSKQLPTISADHAHHHHNPGLEPLPEGAEGTGGGTRMGADLMGSSWAGEGI